MNTRLLLSASAVAMGMAGIAGTFAPHELVGAMGVGATGLVPDLVQLLAALLFAFGMVNWVARGSLIGGIYNRPVAIGNLTHFVIGALIFIRAVARGHRDPAVLSVAALYVIFALGFARIVFGTPVRNGDAGSDAT